MCVWGRVWVSRLVGTGRACLNVWAGEGRGGLDE